MAASFVGMTVNVKLKQPSAWSSVIGRVVNIHDQRLILDQVIFPDTGQSLPSWGISSFQIADLEVIDSTVQHAQPPPQPRYTDPAIVSFHKPASGLTISTNNRSAPAPAVFTPAKELPAEAVETPISVLAPYEKSAESPSKPPQNHTREPKHSGVPLSTVKQSKGWRQTPLLEETSQTTPALDTPPSQPSQMQSNASSQPPQVLETPLKQAKGKPSGRGKKQSRRARDAQQALQDGWATEVATDVQEMGDFDFEANLSKFDKKAVFEEIRNDDMTADEDRLVSHNRLARPGTYGGKNLHPTEMVLSPPIGPVNGETDGLSDPIIDADLRNGRISRQSQQSRNRIKTPTERAFSGATDDRSLSRALRNVSSQRPLNASVLSSTSFNRSTSSVRNAQAHFEVPTPHLLIQATGRLCPAITTDRLKKLTEDYARRPGLTSESLVELKARAVAQAICKSTFRLQDPSRRNSRTSVVTGVGASIRDPKPVIVILAGNHARGAYAIAAARHLYGRGYKLLISCADSPSTSNLHPFYSQQLSLLQSLGRKAFARLDSWPTISAQIKKLNSPPALIVDALLDGTSYGAIEDVQSAIMTREIIDWCNRSRAQVISVACPSGYDEHTGATTVVEGEPVAVKPDRVLALGGVLQGVFDAMAEGEKWSLSVLDVGLSSVMKNEELVHFGDEWSVDVEFFVGD